MTRDTTITRRPARTRGGFTLIEVMMALAILAVALVGLISRTARNVRLTQDVAMSSIAVDLTRSKMYDIEAELLKDGFQELDQSSEGDFSDEGWPAFKWEAKVEKIEIPGLNVVQDIQDETEGEVQGEAPDEAEGESGGFFDQTALGPILDIVNRVLEVSIRKVTVTVTYEVGAAKKQMVAALYLTDANAMNKVIGSIGMGGLGGDDTSDTSSNDDNDSRSGGTRSGGTRSGSRGILR